MRRNKLLKIVLPLVIVLAGAAVMSVLVSRRPAPVKEVKEEPRALVRVLEVKRENRRVFVSGTGTVQAAQEVTIIPQVSGRVTRVAASMAAGRFFHKGDLLFEIDDADYQLALEQAKATRARAEYELARVESSARIARQEWKRMKDETAPNPLVLYEPQMKNARAALDSASAALRQAELNLERTRILSPFNSIVHSEQIEPGQFVRAGNSVAVVTGTDTAEIAIPLSLDEIGWLDIPRSPLEHGSPAFVSISAGGKTYKWQGQVVRSLGKIDPKTHMAKIVVAVKDPYGLASRKDMDLAVGTFVAVKLSGKMLKGVIAIPRDALREGSFVWVMDEEKRLRIKKVTPLRMEYEEVLLKDSLKEGELVVMTTLSGAVDGMKLRVVTNKEL